MGVGTVGGSTRRSGEGAFTLAEMLVALLLVGIVFAGAASALINLSRASVSNERRVQATALMTELHESFQAMPWEAALMYPEEVDELSALDGYAVVDGTPTYEGQPIALFDGDCDPAEACRWEEIPHPFETVTVDGRGYEVFRIITEVDRAGGSSEAIRRLTTLVRFEALGRWVDQQIDSERAATSEELGLPPEGGPSFNIAPSTVPIDADGLLLASVRLDAVFPPEMSTSVQNITATLEASGGALVLDEFQPVLLAEMVRRYTLEGDLEQGGSPVAFSPGTQNVGWSYEYGGEVFTATTPVTFEHDPLAPPSGFDGQIDAVELVAGPLRVARQGGGNSKSYTLCDPLTVSVYASNVDPDQGDQVRAEYTPDDGSATSVELVPQGAGRFAHTFAAGTPSHWWPSDAGTTEVFVISARGGGDPPPTSPAEELTVDFQLLEGNNCP